MSTKSKEKPESKPTQQPTQQPAQQAPPKPEEGFSPKDLENLNREVILEWHRRNMKQKLEGLRDEIITAEPAKKEEIKGKILSKTSENLKKLSKDLPKSERDRMAENFADKFFEAVESTDFEKKMKLLSAAEAEQKLFFAFLGMQGGAAGMAKLQKFKSNPTLQKMFEADPKLSAEFDKIAEEGDMGAMADFLIDKDSTGTFKKIGRQELYFTLSMFSNDQSPVGAMLDQIPVIGDFVGKVVKWGQKAKEFANLPFFNKVSNKLDVKMLNLMNLAGMTLSELGERDRIFSQYRGILDEMLANAKSKSKERKLKRQIRYIDDTKTLYDKILDLRNNHEFEIKQSIAAYLDKHKELDENDKIKIVADLNLDAMKVQSFLPMVMYGADGITKNESYLFWFGELMLRGKRMRHAARFVLGRDWNQYSNARAYYNVMKSRMFDSNARNFRESIKGFKDIEKLYPAIEKFEEEVRKYQVHDATLNSVDAHSKDMIKHDQIVRNYQELSYKISEVMSERANKINVAGIELQKLKLASGPVDLSRISSSTLETLGIKGKGVVDLADIQTAYTKKLFALELLKNDTQKRFADLSRGVAENVIHKFDERWVSRSGVRHISEQVGDIQKTVNRYMKPQNRMWAKAKMLFLPTIAVGVPVADFIRGKSRFKEVAGDVFDVAIGFVPVAGTVNDFKQMWTGRTTSGRKLSKWERVASAAFCAIGAISDAALALGGFGYTIRAGVGSLRVGKGIARAGHYARGVRNLDRDVEGVGWLSRILRTRAAKGEKRMQDGINLVAKRDVYDYMSLTRKGTLTAKDTKRLEELEELKKLDSQYFDKTRQALGIPENPSFLGARRSLTARKADKVKDLEGVKSASKEVGNYNDLIKRRTAIQTELEEAGKIRNPLQRGSKKGKLTRELEDINGKLASHYEIQNRYFAAAERLEQKSIIMNRIQAVSQKVGLFVVPAVILCTVNSDARKTAMEVGGAARTGVGWAYGATKWTLGTAADYRTPPNPLEDLVEDYIEEKRKVLDFMGKVGEIEKSNDPQKKEKIEELCAGYWDNAHVRAWVLTHKRELNVRSIMDRVKQKILQAGDAMMPGGNLRPANMELLKGAKSGSKSLELK